jgi:hypothetical protein
MFSILKRITVVAVILITAISVYFFCGKVNKPEPEAKQIVKQGYTPAAGSKEELYQDLFVSQLHPHIQKAVDDWYSQYSEYRGGTVDPWFTDVLTVERVTKVGSPRRFEFLVKVEVMPYVLAHISVGRDRITFRIQAGGETTVEKFEHIEGFDNSWRLRKPQ